MKVYGIGFLDGDGHGYGIREGNTIYSSFEKAQEEFIKKMIDKEWSIEECKTRAYKLLSGRRFKSKIIELEMSDENESSD